MLHIGVYTCIQITLRYLLITEIIEMDQLAPMVNLPRSPLSIVLYILYNNNIRFS